MREPEHALLLDHRTVLRDEEVPGGQIVEVHQTGMQPFGIRMHGRQLRLQFVVADDAALRRVDEEHATGLQAAALHDLGWIDVEHADFARHDDHAVGRDPVARRPKAVAIEHGADDRAVGERDRRGAVPRLHQRGMELVERALVRRHGLVVLPRLRDHHQHRVRQAAPTELEQLEHLVEPCRVGRTCGADRVGAIEPFDQLATQQRLAGPHPVLVAHHGVDLAVVGDDPVGVGQRP